MVNVFTRKNIAELIGLANEVLMIEVSILQGNDFSSHIDPKTMFFQDLGLDLDEPANILQFTDRDNRRNLENIVKWLNNQYATTNSTAILFSENKKIAKIISFCRDFYELNDLRKYPFDPSEKVLFPLELLREQKELVEKYKSKTLRYTSIGWNAIQFFRLHCHFSNKQQGKNNRTSNGSKNSNSISLDKKLQAIYGKGLNAGVVANVSFDNWDPTSYYSLLFMLLVLEKAQHNNAA